MENFKIISTGYISSDGAVISANILDFGAAGDGKADDTGALNAAIASLAAAAARSGFLRAHIGLRAP